MKLKQLKIIVISAALLVGLATWAYFHWNEETPPMSSHQASNTNNSENLTGHKWFSNVPLSAPNASVGFGGMDADGHVLNLNGKTVNEYVKSLYVAANNGDAKAAFNIYVAESICTSLPQRQRELINIPTNTEQNYVEALQNVIKNTQAVCADYNSSPRERLDYLHAAAKGGNVPAMMSFGTEPPEGIDPTKPLDMNDPRTIQWLKDSVDYMTQAATKGNALAMMGVATYYTQGDIVPQNIPLALTYEMAAQMQRNPNATNFDNYPPISRLESQLTPDQIAAAKADAAALVKSASRNQ